MVRPRNILVFRSCGLGDFILSAPAFRELRRRFPDSRITLLTLQTTDKSTAAKVSAYAGGGKAAPWVDLLRPHLIDDVIVMDPRSLSALSDARSLLKKMPIDLVVQMIDVGVPWPRRLKKLAFIVALLGFVRQIGWRRSGTIQQGRIPKNDPQLGHHVFGPLQFANELDGAPDSAHEVVFDLQPGQEAEHWAGQWLEANRTVGNRLIALAPGAIHAHKHWPTEQFVNLAQGLLDLSDDIQLVVTGTKADQEKAQRILEVDPLRIKDICGQTSIAQSAALFRHCALVVGNDGGAMHLADAMGAAVVSIVPGLEFPNSIEPWHNVDRAVRHRIECAPCYSFTFCPAGHNRCMKDIPLETVLDQCRKAL